MTEYSVSSERRREFNSWGMRTRDWIERLDDPYYSPNVAHSELSDYDDNLSDTSDCESSHSVPPKLMLRYPDGRPDEFIPHVHDLGDPLSPTTISRPFNGRRQTVPSLHSHHSQHKQLISDVPEDIRILPSLSNPINGLRAPPAVSRSQSLPKNTFSPAQENHSVTPPIVSQPLRSPPWGPPQHINIHKRPITPSEHAAAFAAQQISPWHAPMRATSSRHGPPSIVYAPPRHASSHYRPPVILSHPPNVGPDGIIYSHSDPIPHPSQQQPRYRITSDGSVMEPSEGPHHRHRRSKSSPRESRRKRSKSLPGNDANRSSPTLRASSSIRSRDSGGSYYVIASNEKQRIHIIRTPDTSTYASSPTQSPTSPMSHKWKKAPFFQKLFNISQIFSASGHSHSSKASSTHSGKRLHRHNSTGGSRGQRPRAR